MGAGNEHLHSNPKAATRKGILRPRRSLRPFWPAGAWAPFGPAWGGRRGGSESRALSGQFLLRVVLRFLRRRRACSAAAASQV